MKKSMLLLCALLFSGQALASGSACAGGACAVASGSPSVVYNAEGAQEPQLVDLALGYTNGKLNQEGERILQDTFMEALVNEQIPASVSFAEFAQKIVREAR